MFPESPFLACTATATKRVKESIVQHLGLKEPVVLEGSFNSKHCQCRWHAKQELVKKARHVIPQYKQCALRHLSIKIFCKVIVQTSAWRVPCRA